METQNTSNIRTITEAETEAEAEAEIRTTERRKGQVRESKRRKQNGILKNKYLGCNPHEE
jgi:hypothetical protein